MSVLSIKKENIVYAHNIAYITEGNSHIGMGHVYECLNLSYYLRSVYNVKPYFLVSSDTIMPDDSLFTLRFDEYPDIVELIHRLRMDNIGTVVIDMKSVKDSWITPFVEAKLTTICIDELSDRNLSSDIIINSSIVKDIHKYTLKRDDTKCFFGTLYKIIGNTFYLYAGKNKSISGSSKILVNMGGTDRDGATLKIVRALKQLDDSYMCIIKIGPAFLYKKELEDELKNLKCRYVLNFHVDDMAKLFYDADVCISAGGNTLYETVCVGTPAIVLWEDVHEGVQAASFETEHTVINLGQSKTINNKLLLETITTLLTDKHLWEDMSLKGKNLVDGRGVMRVGDIIMGDYSFDFRGYFNE
ncbi:pseudaminic acid biosynthesis-associated protein PseG [Candidatus Magnetobacterium bavaricum]|uniref:Pseudaminic acid biosynthesis-associated protein PseG n=1 Tax=Candidatus Magnetobacterium bavaricum TaxID=29290 RepID=A0A0F3GJQ5_9BACT|nr:pseudaminic acid biosynthesis-associated protein PseG [Candidatus Magnetobacterium bavaricum]